MLRLKREYEGTEQLIRFKNGDNLLIRLSSSNLSQQKRLKILNAGYPNFFENAAEFIKKPEARKKVKAKFKIVKVGRDAESVKAAFREQGALVTKASQTTISQLKAMDLDTLKKEFPRKADILEVAQKLNETVEDCDISLKLKMDGLYNEVELTLKSL